MAGLTCSACSTPVLIVEHVTAKHIIDKLADEFGPDFMEGVARCPIAQTMSALVNRDEIDLDGDLVYCPDCVVKLIIAGVHAAF